MAVLGTYTNVSSACLLAASANCFLHALPTTPDWAVPVPLGLAGSAALSVPIHLITRGATIVAFQNMNPAMNHEYVAQFCHSIIR